MAIRNNTEKQLEEVFQRNIHCQGSFSKEVSPELYEVCKKCENYMGDNHDYSECREMQCFKNWLALEYLDWVNGY